MQNQSSFLFITDDSPRVSRDVFKIDISRQLMQINKHLVDMHNNSKDDEVIQNDLEKTNTNLNDIIKNLRSILYNKNIPFDNDKISQVIGGPTEITNNQQSRTNLQGKMNNIINERKGKSKERTNFIHR